MGDLLTAALSLCEVILAQESLRHPKHMSILEPLTERARAVLADYFQHQKRALIHWVKYRIVREDAEKRRAVQLLPSELSPLTFGVTTHESQEYQAAIGEAM